MSIVAIRANHNCSQRSIHDPVLWDPFDQSSKQLHAYAGLWRLQNPTVQICGEVEPPFYPHVLPHEVHSFSFYFAAKASESLTKTVLSTWKLHTAWKVVGFYVPIKQQVHVSRFRHPRISYK